MSIKNIYKNSYLYLFIYSIVFIIISFVSVNSASIAYDYTFHIGRIVGLAQSLANKDFLPNLNYSFLKGGLDMQYRCSMEIGCFIFLL